MKNNAIRNTILVIGFIILLFLFLGNIIFSVSISNDLLELTSIKYNNPIYMIIILAVLIGIYKLLDILDLKLSKKNKIILFIITLILFITIQIVWIEYRNFYPYNDQLSVYETAQYIFHGTTSKLMHNRYLEFCPQQINISLIWAFIFKIFNSTNIKIIQYMNVIANVISLITLLKISNILKNKFEINKIRLVFFFTTFIPIILLSSFPYGDFPGLCLSLLAILFILKYTESSKLKNFFISSIFMSLACLVRINYIIVFIAIIIYLIINFIKKYELKDSLVRILLLLLFTLIALLPTQIIKTTFQNKYKLNKNYAFPTSAYLYIAMTESDSGNGWYGANIIYAWEHPGESDAYYKKQISKRLNYFKSHPLYFVEFYVKKELSMWTENTYQSVWNNESFNIKEPYGNYDVDNHLLYVFKYIYGWQKMIVLMILSISICYMFKEFKKMDNNLTLILLVFIGGFMFHTLWEAKSRYVIPYLIVLFIIASLKVSNKKHTN